MLLGGLHRPVRSRSDVRLVCALPADAERAREGLEDEGWRSEESAQGVYVTEDPQYAMSTDEDGYGMTYLFGDGWVKVADTKQGLLLVEGRD